MAENRWQVSTYITDKKVYNNLKVYLMENNVKMSVVLMAGLKAVLAGKIDLDGNVIAEAKDEVQKAQSESITPPQAEASSTQKPPAIKADNKYQAAWQAVCDAQQAAHKATFGNVDSAIDDWLIALTDALGVVIQG